MIKKMPLIVSLIWFVIGMAWLVLVVKDLLAGGGSATLMFVLVAAVSFFAAFTNFRRYRKLK